MEMEVEVEMEMEVESLFIAMHPLSKLNGTVTVLFFDNIFVQLNTNTNPE